MNSEFVSDYLNTNTLESLINDYNMIAHCTIVRYGRLNDNTQAWIKQVSSGLWKALQEHYNVKPTTLYQICTTDEGAFYSENPDAQPKEAKETVREVVAIDENGKNIYESKENITTVSYYGDYAIAHISKWKFGGGSYGWNNGKFYDKADKWTNDKIERVYFKGGMIFESYSGEEKTTPFLFIDGILLEYCTSDLDKNDKYIWVAYPKELRPKH